MHSSTIRLYIVLTILSIMNCQSYNPDLASNCVSYTVSSYCNQKQLSQWNCGKTCDNHPEVKDIQLLYNKTGDTSGYVAYNTKYNSIMAVFRGTLPWSIKDWIDDINFIKTDFPLCNNGCKVHRGFYYTWLDLQQQFWNAFLTLNQKYPNSPILVTGHSLGGALATHCAADLISKGYNGFTFYSFGAPRVGDQNFKNWFTSVYSGMEQRVTHHKDPVPHLPPKEWGFWHTPQEIFYTQNQDSYQVCNTSGEDPDCSDKYLLDVNIPDHITYLKYDFAVLVLACQV